MAVFAHARPVRRRLLAILGAAAASLAVAATVAIGAVQTSASNAPTAKADGVDAVGIECTSDLGFVDMPGLTTTFTTRGSAPKPVIVLFQSEWVGIQGEPLMRLTIDGVQQSPGEVRAADVGSAAQTHGFNFVSSPLAPGTHTATMQFRSETAARRVCVGDRSLIVLHK
jgi:hypothetical protein